MEKLFIKYCPIFYFHKKEPYMPTNFDEILKLFVEITSTYLHETKNAVQL